MSDIPSTFEGAAGISLPRLVKFVRQVTHDVRNGLNAIDLQAALVAEIAGDGEVSDELRKLRGVVCHMTREMQNLSSRFGEVRPVLMKYPVQEFIQGVKETVQEEFVTQAKRVVWEVKLAGEEEIEMDYALLSSALIELIRNAIYFREGDQAIHFTAWDEKGQAIFEVRQTRGGPVADADTWGREPLSSSRRGGYGLGLFYVRRIMDALGGAFDPVYDAKTGELKARLILPVGGGGAANE